MTLIQINLTYVYEHTCKEFYWFTRVKINEKQEFVFMCSRGEQKERKLFCTHLSQTLTKHQNACSLGRCINKKAAIGPWA